MRKKFIMSTLLQVAQLGHPVIRAQAKQVENIKNKRIQQLIDDLIATVMDVNGVGMAAPQVYQSLRICIVASHPNPRYPNAPEMEPTPMINPRLISHNKIKAKDWEGCLSIPGVRALVSRYTGIKAEYTDRKGKLIKVEYSDFLARIFQHENDHLDGIVFLDRLKNMQEVITEKEYLKIITKK